ncbi:Flp family type IVb pilin [Arthrobacter humicola]|uniref:Flp family type IVb pilin n=1 Tax=Arthrobacter humicola TaxID=409291 RepID=UPI0027DF04CF|nr:Flp family type IVb pilin [Arthrobacter humicola]
MKGLSRYSLTLRRAAGAGRWGKLSSEAGATAVEYGLLVALIAAVIIGIVGTLGGQLIPGFQSVVDGL